MKPSAAVFFTVLSLSGVASASAQTDEPPALSVAATAGIAFPFHSDFRFDAFDWHASIRGRGGEHFLIEGMLDQWRKSKTSRRTNVPIYGRLGVIGHIDELTIRELDTISVVGVNLLGTGNVGRMRIAGGGGPGFMVGYDRHTTTASGCSAPSPSLCDGSTNAEMSLTFSVHAVADVEFALTPHLSAVGRFMLALPVKDPGYGHLNTTAGLRLSFR